jgi:hypothetical protein
VRTQGRRTAWGDFGGTCLLGSFQPVPELLLPGSTIFGIPKAGSYLYGTWRDEEGCLFRALRAIGAPLGDFAFLFSSVGDEHLTRLDRPLFDGSSEVQRHGEMVRFAAPDDAELAFSFLHEPAGCVWREADVLQVDGWLLGPGLEWYHPWPEGGGCYTATIKYASEGTFGGRTVRGFVGHEIHYLPAGSDWYSSRYGLGMEICWQQVANEYADGTFIHATFAYGTDGWGFAMIHDEDGTFHASTDVEVEAEIRPNGVPERITYTFPGDQWTWTIDELGERPAVGGSALIGADGTCRRVGDDRTIVRSLGNSDWWTDGRYESSRPRPAGMTPDPESVVESG